MSPHRIRAYFFILVATIIWGIAAPVIKFTLGEIEPFTFLFLRFFLATIFGLIAIAITKPNLKPVLRNLPIIFIYCTLATTISLGGLFLGLNKTTVLELNIITIIAPLLVSLAGVVAFRDRITKREKLGTLIAVFGTTTALLLPVVATLNGHGIHISGTLFLVIHLTSDVVAVILNKKLLKDGVDAMTLSYLAFIIGFISLAPLVLATTPVSTILQTVTNLSLPAILGILYMTFLSGTVAYGLRNMSLKTIEVSEQALFGYLGPLISIPIAIVWLGEQITISFIVGAVIIAIGVAIAEIKVKR